MPHLRLLQLQELPGLPTARGAHGLLDGPAQEPAVRAVRGEDLRCEVGDARGMRTARKPRKTMKKTMENQWNSPQNAMSRLVF